MHEIYWTRELIHFMYMLLVKDLLKKQLFEGKNLLSVHSILIHCEKKNNFLCPEIRYKRKTMI